MRELLLLYITFCKIGAFTFGGGYAMLPMLESEIVKKHKWATNEELLDYFAIGQCTPGVIAANTATFIGYKKKGILGGIIATLGVITPSVIIISIITMIVNNFSDIKWVQNALCGIRVCVCVLICNSVIKISKSAIVDRYSFILFLIAFAVAVFLNISTVYIVILAGLSGYLIKKLSSVKKEDK